MAVTAEFNFNENVTEQRYLKFISKIRCLLCQNESLGSSRADLAVDLRRQIFQMMEDGQSNQEISAYLIDRYGDFILYQPPLKKSTLLLWFGPFILVGFLLWLLINRVKHLQTKPPKTLSDDDKTKARQLLDKN